MNLKRKSVLFICPVFFGYEKSIKNAIEENGFDVDYFDERPSNNALMKAIARTKKSVLNIFINKHYDLISKKIRGKKFDFFFLIKGEVIPEKFIVEFKKNNPSAKLIYYTYDSANNNTKNALEIQKYFDDSYSIDFRDVEKNPDIKLKHLFYGKDFAHKTHTASDRPYEISFVGTLHSNRYSVMKNTFDQFQKYYLFLYSPAKWWFFYNKIFNKEYKNIDNSLVSFEKISLAEVANIFQKSQSVLDVQRFGQAGLTMRTFEVLASGAILITTNPFIKTTDFYDENRIVCIDEEDIISDSKVNEIKKKLNSHHHQLKNFDKYFVNNWVKEFFE